MLVGDDKRNTITDGGSTLFTPFSLCSLFTLFTLRGDGLDGYPLDCYDY